MDGCGSSNGRSPGMADNRQRMYMRRNADRVGLIRPYSDSHTL